MERSILMKVFLKKFGVIAAAASILFAFSACSDSNGTGNPNKTSSTITTQTDSTDTSHATYVIESIEGNVTYECAPNTFAKVMVGQELSASTVIKIGLNSSVVIKCGGKSVTIPAKQQGTVETLCAGV